jgi:hypothetical protein
MELKRQVLELTTAKSLSTTMRIWQQYYWQRWVSAVGMDIRIINSAFRDGPIQSGSGHIIVRRRTQQEIDSVAMAKAITLRRLRRSEWDSVRRAWHHWICQSQWHSRILESVFRYLLRGGGRALVRAWQLWRSLVLWSLQNDDRLDQAANAFSRAMHRVLRAMEQRQLNRGFRHWQAFRQQCVRAKVLVVRCLQQWERRNVASGWHCWRAAMQWYAHAEGVMSRYLKRWLRVALGGAWRCWLVSLGLDASSKHQWELQSMGVRVMRRVVKAMDQRQLHHALRHWQAFRQQCLRVRTITGRCLQQWERRNVASGWHCWRAAMQWYAHAEGVMSRYLKRWLRVALGGAWRCWLVSLGLDASSAQAAVVSALRRFGVLAARTLVRAMESRFKLRAVRVWHHLAQWLQCVHDSVDRWVDHFAAAMTKQVRERHSLVSTR